ncbi:Rnase Y domain-containing protein [Patescibacteria group bacterium]
MENLLINIIVAFVGLGVGAVFTNHFLKGRNLIDLEKKEEQAKKIKEKSMDEAKKMRSDNKMKAEKRKENFDQIIEQRKKRFKKMEDYLEQKETIFKKKELKNQEIEKHIDSEKKEVEKLKTSTENLEKKTVDELSRRLNTTLPEMKKEVLNRYQKELEQDVSEKYRRFEENLKENSVKKAKRILIDIMQRLSFPTSVESRAVTVDVPKDYIKGKIVGKKGCNVIELEDSLGVDIIFNDLPNTISVSAFNLVSRRIAQKTIEKLTLVRGEINSKIIQNAIKDAERETEDELYKIGKKTVDDIKLEVKDKELVKIIGRLKYRTSYGQNIMKHSQEVGWVAAMLGSELGINSEICKVAGFLHDLGKAIDQDPDIEDTHDNLTKTLMEKYGFSWEEIHAAWTHHDAAQQETPEALIVKGSDAISAGRPGARQESIEKYFERIKALESITDKHEGIKKSFAISAGRELRVIVEPEKIKDDSMPELAKIISDEIEEELTYPGKIKVNVIRKTEYLENAK